MPMYGPDEFGDRESNPFPMPDDWDGPNPAFQVIRNGDGRSLYNIGDPNASCVDGDPFNDDDSMNLPIS